jgi:hypothetical protein
MLLELLFDPIFLMVFFICSNSALSGFKSVFAKVSRGKGTMLVDCFLIGKGRVYLFKANSSPSFFS